MSNRKTKWIPYLGGLRAQDALADTCRQLLSLYDLGERIPPGMWEILRERLTNFDRSR